MRYCINGMILQSAALLAANKHPTDEQFKQALTYNVRTVKRAASGSWRYLHVGV
jgi:aerobic-type carbon monoxide dehydrogenase small subunit (CoxS/CutS family)